MDQATHQRRLALFTFFFLPGVSIASWITRTPAIRDSIGASIAEMGGVLFGLSIGSMTGILSSGSLVKRYGSKPISCVGMLLIVASMFTISLGVELANALSVGIGLMLLGLGMGMAEIAINIDGTDIERMTGRPLMHALHGCFSCGTVCGALIGLGLTSVNFSVAYHLCLIGTINIVAISWALPKLISGVGRAPKMGESSDALIQKTSSAWKDKRLALIGFIVLAMALAEGSANDWLPLLMVDEYGFSQVSGSFVFLAFASAMTVGRFCGGYFLHRYGRANCIRGCALIGALGLLTVIFSESAWAGSVAVILWGLGTSLGFPVALTAAGESAENPEARVKMVAMGGYIAFLVGPPMLGIIGEAYDLRVALVVVLAMMAITAIAAPAVKPDVALRKNDTVQTDKLTASDH